MSQQQYEKSLEKILATVEKDYWTQYVDINRHQVVVSRAYLWVSVALMGAYIAGLDKIGIPWVQTPIYSVLFIVISFLLGISAFGTCLFGIPARQGYITLHTTGWGELSHEAYELRSTYGKKSYPVFLGSFISRFDHATKHNTETNINRGKLLRVTSWLLLISLASAFLAGTTLLAYKSQLKAPEEIVMPENENTDNAPVSQSTTDDIPPPPPPAGAAQGSDITTHSADTSNMQSKRIFIDSANSDSE